MAVSYNKMSAIKVAGTYINNIASGTSLGDVSLDITGKSHFTSDVLVDGSFNILNINSADPSSNFNLATNQTTGNINIGTGLTTGAVNISNTTTLNAPITIGSLASATQTLDINANTTFSKIPSTSIAPTIANHLCNKNYVDSQITGSSILGTNNTWTGTNAFNTSLPTSTITGGPFPSGTFTTNNYVDTLIALERSNFKASNNTWTGTNAFNTSLPTSTLTPSTSTELTTKAYVDSQVSGGSILGTNNTWTGTNAFNTSLPTSTLTPSTSTQLTTKAYVDSVAGTTLLSSNNTWTGTNAFNTSLPTSTLTPSTNTQLTTKAYVDSVAGTALLSSNNTWTGTNAFNTSLPTSTLTPSTSTQLTTKAYVDSMAGTALLSSNNTWTGTNAFNTSLPTSTLTPSTSTQLTTKAYVDTIPTNLLASNNVWTNENDFSNVVKVKDPTLASYAGIDLFSSVTAGIVINGVSGTTSALSGVNLNTNTLTVPIKNNQSLIRIRIPMNIAGFGVPSFYFGQLDIIFNSITAITILKNGSFYKNVSVFNLLNFTGTTKSWTGWSQKGENARAYIGDVQFELEITTGNASVDTYTIGITMDVAVNAGAVLYITPRFLCQNDTNFTQTHATTTTGTTYISTDPVSYFPYQIDYGDDGNYIIGKGDINIKTIQGGRLKIDTGTNIVLNAQSGIDLLAGTGDVNISGGGVTSLTSTGTITTYTGGNYNVSADGASTIAIGGALTTTAGGATSITTPSTMTLRGNAGTTLGYNGTSTTTIEGSTIQIRAPLSPLYTALMGAQVGVVGCRIVVPFTSSTASGVTNIYTQNNFPIGVWIVEIKTTFSYSGQPPASAWYRIGTSGVSGQFNDPTRMCDFNPNSSGSQNCHFTTTYQFAGNSPLYVVQQHSGTTITTPTNGSYVSYTRIA
jgi:hypothetical protein